MLTRYNFKPYSSGKPSLPRQPKKDSVIWCSVNNRDADLNNYRDKTDGGVHDGKECIEDRGGW